MVLENLFKKGINSLLDILEPYFVNPEQIQSQYGNQFYYPGLQKQPHPPSPHFYPDWNPKGIFDSTIIGMEDLKKIMVKCINSKEPVKVLLCGPPASAKTLFLLAIYKEVNNCYFIDGANSTGAGLIDYLFENPETQVLLIDELDKINKRDQTSLLNLLETGILSSTKVRKTARQEMHIKVFATSNEEAKISKPLRSRMLEFHLRAYSFEEFLDISKELLFERYNHRKELSEVIAQSVWNIMKSKDIRDVLAVGKLTSSIDDVNSIVQTMIKYGSAHAEESSRY